MRQWRPAPIRRRGGGRLAQDLTHRHMAMIQAIEPPAVESGGKRRLRRGTRRTRDDGTPNVRRRLPRSLATPYAAGLPRRKLREVVTASRANRRKLKVKGANAFEAPFKPAAPRL